MALGLGLGLGMKQQRGFGLPLNEQVVTEWSSASGNTDTAEEERLQAFFQEMIDGGMEDILRDGSSYINFLGGDDLTVARYAQLQGVATNRQAGITNFVEGDYTQSGVGYGLAASGTEHLDTLVANDQFSDPEELTFVVFVTVAPTVSGTREFMGLSESGEPIYIQQETATDLEFRYDGAPGNIRTTVTIGEFATGLIVFTIRNGNDAEFYYQGASVGTDSTGSSLLLHSIPFYMFARNNEGSPQNHIDGTMSCIMILNRGLSDAEQAALSTAFDNYNTSRAA